MKIENIGLRDNFNLNIASNANSEGISFAEFLKEAVNNAKQYEAIDTTNNYLLSTGQAESLHKIMIDIEKADIALQFTLQVRNKIMDAYQEIMRLQI